MIAGAHTTEYRIMSDSRTLHRLEEHRLFTTVQYPEILRRYRGDATSYSLQFGCLAGHDPLACLVSSLSRNRLFICGDGTDDSSLYTTGRIVANFMQKALDLQSFGLAIRYRADLTTIQSRKSRPFLVCALLTDST